MRTHTYSGRGYSGISTVGVENTNTIISRPDIAGQVGFKYKAKNNGIKIIQRRAIKKSRISNPVILRY